MSKDLFNPTTIEKYSNAIQLSYSQKTAASKWLSYLDEGSLSGEKSNYLKFSKLILEQILGYEIEKINYEMGNIEFSYKNDEGKSVLGIEVKGVKKDLSSQQRGYKTWQNTPINQLWNYMGSLNLNYGIATNYKNFEFILKNEGFSTRYSFDFESTRDNEEKLKEFVLIFSKDQLIDKKMIEILTKESDLEDQKFTKEFYKLFSETRLMFIKEFQEKGVPLDKAVHYSQIYLNRLMFIFFAEDTGKLDYRIFEKQIIKTLTGGLSLPQYIGTLVSTEIKSMFKKLNIGFKEYGQNFNGFNGGLFREDIPEDVFFDDLKDKSFFTEAFQNYKLDKLLDLESESVINEYKGKLNPLIKNILLMASFDFKTEISVNILGHIFEQSLTDIEKIKEGKSSKRKKDGVYYTQENITDYICRNTIIKHLSNKNSRNAKELVNEYSDNISELEEKFRSIKIIDPACGSGAFLIKAVDVLLEIYKEIQSFKEEKGVYATSIKRGKHKGKSKANYQLTSLAKYSDEDEAREIIENSIFGVDLNEESVEITKLSMFLKIAKKDTKLCDLSDRIKCGNSLIDDSSIDIKAFNWENEFKEVLKGGGFDIVIGNPPYVKARDKEGTDKTHRKFIEKKFSSAYKMWDLYIPFIELGLEILKPSGKLGMIIPDTIGKAEYSLKIIDIIESRHQLYQIDFFPNMKLFEDATVTNKIIFINKNVKEGETTRILHDPTVCDITLLPTIQDSSKYLAETYNFVIGTENTIPLSEICFVSYGLRLNSDKDDKQFKFKKTDLISENKTEVYKKIYTEGKYIDRYVILKELYVEWDTERCPAKLVRPTFPELYPPNKLLLSREKKIGTFTDQGHVCDNTIIMAILAKDLKDVENRSIAKYYSNLKKDRRKIEEKSENFDLKFLLSIINSNLIKYHIKVSSKGKIDFYPDDWKKIPIKEITKDEQIPFVEKVNVIFSLIEDIKKRRNKFFTILSSNFGIKENKKLENFEEKDYSQFLQEISKQKKDIDLITQERLFDFFEGKKKEILDIKRKMENVDQDLNEMVYKLYGINQEERKIIEDN